MNILSNKYRRQQVTMAGWLLGAAFLLLNSSLFVSCSDNDSSEDPSGHLRQTVANYEDVLKNATNGWVMAFYGNTDFGGYNVLCKFGDNGQVVVANEFFGADSTAVTHYKFEQSGGVVLSFDEYCPLIHFFSDPVNPSGFGAGTADGFGGDLEFRVISASADSVVLSGKKHGARVKLTPLAQDVTWSNYINGVKEVETVMMGGYYNMVSGTDSLRMKGDRQNRTLTYSITNDEGESFTHVAPFLITPQGISFYEPVQFAGQSVTGFVYQPSATTFEQQGGGTVKLARFMAPINEQLIDGTWFISKENLGTYATQRWNVFAQRMQRSFNLTIYFAVFGTYYDRFGLSVGSIDATDPTGIYLAECYYDYELIGDDKIRLWFNGESDEIGNGAYFLESGGMDYAIQAFGADETRSRTFLVETDNVNNPTYLRLVDQAQANNIITLTREEVLFPFGE